MSIHNTHSVHNSIRHPVDEERSGKDNRKNAECRMQNAELNREFPKGSFRGRELAPKVTEGLVCKEMNHKRSPFISAELNSELREPIITSLSDKQEEKRLFKYAKGNLNLFGGNNGRKQNHKRL